MDLGFRELGFKVIKEQGLGLLLLLRRSSSLGDVA